MNTTAGASRAKASRLLDLPMALRLGVPLVVLALAFAAMAAYAANTILGLGGDVFDSTMGDVVFIGVIALAGIACLLRAALVPGQRLAWLAIGAGLACWTAGEILWAVQEDVRYPSTADVLFLADYPLTFAGIVLLVRARIRERSIGQWLDGAIAAVAAVAISVALLAPALMDLTGARRIEKVIVNLAYPVGDLLLLAFLVLAVVLVGWRFGRAWGLLAAGLGILAVADGLFLYQEAIGVYSDPSTMDNLWLVGAFLVGLAAWQPSGALAMRASDRPALVVPMTAALVAVGIIGAYALGGLNRVSLALAAATLLLVVVRLLVTLREVASWRHEASTDALTGLRNRRGLIADLGRELGDRFRNPREDFVLAMYDLDGFKAYNDSFGHAAGDLLLKRVGRRFAAATSPGSSYRLGGDEFCVLAPVGAGGARAIVEDAAAALVEEGEGFSIRSSYGWVLVPEEADGVSAALKLADNRMYAWKGRRPDSAEHQARDLLLGMIRVLASGLDQHLDGTARLAAELGRACGLDSEELDLTIRASELHDIGKVSIPDEILDKPGPLDDVEWEIVSKHTLVGERILASAPALSPIARIVRSSHERWDGRGYPDGLAGEDIPLAARISFVCDAFNAMISDRPYRAARTHQDAIRELRKNAGTQFDPHLVELFCERVAPALLTAEARESESSPARGRLGARQPAALGAGNR